MPREQVEWYVEQSLHDNDKIHAHQCCTYYSIVNANKANYPYTSSYEQEQTWTLTRTMSNHGKRYQSSIENIHLTIPCVVNLSTPITSIKNNCDYEIDKTKIERSISLLPPLPPTRQYALPSYRLNRLNTTDSKIYQHDNHHNRKQPSSMTEKSLPGTNLMRIIHVNGEYVVRI
ncbi:unnamed protein product [Adineta steineri]|uniref:Uncharacterized protein n=1 Tax=Adineta steineri TaxID=433720 RepID=A0A814W584_9BILA|nr:unnamed protein product [Adineta steineri]CAF3517450.1 unnamed protein product [Adineta steineri]